MEETGLREGILFIDEINCVSETLAPTMLQFLQCNTFGNQKIPTGWIIVAAGNPPEYNKSVRDFDVVTLDRIKKIDVDVNYDVWKEYAYRADISISSTGRSQKISPIIWNCIISIKKIMVLRRLLKVSIPGIRWRDFDMHHLMRGSVL